MKRLGVNCSSKYTFLAMVEDGEIVVREPQRIQPPPGSEESERLSGFYDDFARALADLKPDEVCLIMPENDPRNRRTHSELVPRIGMETIVRLVAVRAQPPMPIAVLARRTVRSRLGLPPKGKLIDLVEQVIPDPVGKHWRDARDLAALAALAGTG